ncbi:uncharacterized protein METZ01_LOCUS203832 [marine metagenome]|uniref:Uncharacterized protein n=1 Tax=marine metagenome TaxID=408172 RepID=A0A382EJS2_9ZZZZ
MREENLCNPLARPSSLAEVSPLAWLEHSTVLILP